MPDGSDEDRELWKRFAEGRPAREAAGCPDEVVLAAFLDGRGAADERERLEAHLAGCGRCLSAVAEAARIVEAPLAPVPDALLVRVLDLVAAETRPGRTKHTAPAARSFRPALPAWMAAAAALLLTSWAGFALGARAVPDGARLRGQAVGEMSFGLREALALEGEPEPFALESAR